jgi:hypothetical protein
VGGDAYTFAEAVQSLERMRDDRRMVQEYGKASGGSILANLPPVDAVLKWIRVELGGFGKPIQPTACSLQNEHSGAESDPDMREGASSENTS